MLSRHVDWVDRAALGASLLCLIHCLALPLLLAALPALSRVIALPESVHLWILGFAVPTAVIALISGHARHGAAYPVAVGIGGLCALAIGVMPVARHVETVITVTGSLALASAHIQNWRLRHAAHGHD